MSYRFAGASYLELCDLVISGSRENGLNIDDGGDPDKPAHHITLRNIRIKDVGPKGNVDGIKLSVVDDLRRRTSSLKAARSFIDARVVWVSVLARSPRRWSRVAVNEAASIIQRAA